CLHLDPDAMFTAVKLQPMIAAIEQYGKALDVYANAYPLVLSPLWGSIRVVLHLAREFAKFFERFVDMFATIGDLLPRFRVYESLFPSHERLVQALSTVYVDILTFCSEAKSIFRRERRSVWINVGILGKSSWKPLQQQFGKIIDGFRVHVKNVDKEVSLSHMVEASDSRALVRAQKGAIERAKKEDAHRRIIAAIPSVDNFAQHKKLQKLRKEGTGSWILHHRVYQKWYDAARSSSICCFGIPGCGKTILASSIVDVLVASIVSPKPVIAYHYCDYANRKTLQAETILGTILKQFLVNGHIPEELEKKFPRGYGEDAHTLDVGDLSDLLCVAIRRFPLAFIVIDGLDECEKASRKVVLDLLHRLQKPEKSTVKTFISCRQEDQILRSFEGVLMVQMTASALKDDIQLFVADSVSSRIESGELRVRNPDLAQEITDELVNKAQGMFLWAFFQLDDLCEAPSDALIRQTLQNLPNGLIETYERILDKIRRDKIKRLMQETDFADLRRWFRLRAIRIQRNPVHTQSFAEESCKGLVVWDREDGMVRFAHHTVQQFLLSDSVSTQENDLKSSEHEAESYVGEMCLTYLLFSDFETQIQTRPAHLQPQQFLDVPQVGPAYWIPDMLGVRTSKIDQPLRLFGLRSTSSPARPIDYAKYLKSASAASAEIVEKYMLLQYIIENWVFHTKGFESSSTPGRKLQDLAMHKNLPFEFRPWGQNQHYGPYGCGSCKPGGSSYSEAERLPFMSLFHYAAEVGNFSLMEPLIEDYCSHEMKDSSSRGLLWDAKGEHCLLARPLLKTGRHTWEKNDWTICIAIRSGHSVIFERLLEQYGVETNAVGYPTKICTMLNVAASFGYQMILITLMMHAISSGCWRFYTRDCASTSIALAAANGHQAIIDALYREIGDFPLDKRVDRLGETAISAAAANGHDHVVQFLIAKGAQLVMKAVTPLHRAAENGHTVVAHTLLNAGQIGVAYHSNNILDPPHLAGALDSDGETPVQRAARNGHADVLQLMFEYVSSSKENWLLATYSKKAEPQELIKEGTALHLAAANGHIAVVELFYAHMGDSGTQGHEVSAFMAAVIGNHVELVQWLLGHLHRPGNQSDALRVAVGRGYLQLVEILLDHSPMLVTLDLFVLAAKNDYGEILEHLIRTHERGG
ncbi:MAG: hypothetical protein Q9180_004806, partial [Flavoplaca navasiana]